MTIARWIVAGFGVLVCCLGTAAVVWPSSLVDFSNLFVTTRGLWIAAALRLAIGGLLWLAAPAARTPFVFRMFGVLYLLSGVLLPILGLDFLVRMVAWGSGLDEVTLRAMGLLAASFGAFFAWSAAPRRSEP